MTEFSSELDLDLSLLQEIADGSDEFIVESIDMFLSQTPMVMQEVSDAIDAMDWTATSAAAHKLKATLGFFGMLATQALTQDIESICRSAIPSAVEITSKFEQIQALVATNTVALLKIRAEAQANF